MDLPDPTTLIQLLIFAAVVGVVGTILILRRERKSQEPPERDTAFTPSTEGQSRCPNCGFGNLVTDETCASCGVVLPK